MDTPTPDQILDLYDELGRPSATKFQLALKRRLGFNVSVEEVQRIVGLQSERQVLAPPPKFEGKVFSLGIDDKWVADVMVLPAESTVTHVLVVQDVFSRYLWAEPMVSQAAVTEPMQKIMRSRQPRLLYTDADTAFKASTFQEAMEELGVDARTKTGRQDIATVDRAIAMLKETIVKYRSTTGNPDWADHIAKAVKAFNSNDLEYLMHEAPKDVKEGTDIEFMLKRKNMEFVRHNVSLLAKKTNKLTDKGHFRVYIAPPKTKGWRRVGDARWSPEIHTVERIEREMVVDNEGRRYPVKEVLPVEGASTELKMVGRGLSIASQKKRDALIPARDEVVMYLENAGGQEIVRKLTAKLRENSSFFDILAGEGLSRKAPLDAFVALFPDVFEFTGSGSTRSIRLKDK